MILCRRQSGIVRELY